MKKQIGLVAFTALLITFMAFSGVASAQTSNVHIVYFGSPMCSACQQVHPLLTNAAAKYGVTVEEHDVSDSAGKGIAQANNVMETPTIIITGAQSARYEGLVSQATLETAIKAAIGNPATPTPAAPKVVQKVATPTPAPVVRSTATPPPVVKATTTPTPTPPVTQPNIQVLQPTQNQSKVTSATQSVPEFSLLGLGAPALVVGAIYLFMRRK